MKVVNINDIEDLILAKHEIDLMRIDHEEISERSILKRRGGQWGRLFILNYFINTFFPL